ncbi:MAG TPA: AmmeMemoRadiSam system protein A [bacterium]|nr:AmmeMemoRadiSam system protein A [bacterium]
MGIVWGGIAPHPPIIVPEIGRGEEERIADTIQGMKRLAASLKDAAAETVVITTPHGPVFSDAVAVSLWPKVNGSLAQFGAPAVGFEPNTDEGLAAAIITASAEKGVPTVELGPAATERYRTQEPLDHGVLVPWYFFHQAGVNLPLVWIGMSLLPPAKLHAFGTAVNQASVSLNRKVAFLASADLSHRLTRGAPAGYHPDGARFDQLVVDKVRHGDFEAVRVIDPQLAERAGECGWRSIIMLSGALEGYDIKPEVFSYQGTFGVGYLVAEILVSHKDKTAIDPQNKESVYVRLARKSLETYIRTGKTISVPADIPPQLAKPAATFVTLKKGNQLRGCIGTILPTRPNLALEIITNAVSAGCRDPRFTPVTEDELADLQYSVDVLSPPEAIDSVDELDPKRYGVIVRGWGGRTGLLLPNLDGVDTVEEQVKIAKDKANLGPRDKVRLERFEVKRYC